MKNKLKQKELAGRLGISNSYLSMVLSGKRKCPPVLLDKLQSTPGIHNLVKNQLRSPLHTQEVSGSNPLLPTILKDNLASGNSQSSQVFTKHTLAKFLKSKDNRPIPLCLR